MIRTIVVDPLAPSYLAFKEVDAPQAKPWEALVQVKTVSLNRGEVKDAKDQEASSRPGWDFAGIVIEPAKSGEGPQKGARVVGLLPMGAWSEQVAAPVSMLAEIPEKLTFAEAATLPVAGLTALYALRKGGMLLGKRIFITGSTGGVGLFAHQLAAQSGAFVVGTASTEEKADLVREAGFRRSNHWIFRNFISPEIRAVRSDYRFSRRQYTVGVAAAASAPRDLRCGRIFFFKYRNDRYDESGDQRRKNLVWLLSR